MHAKSRYRFLSRLGATMLALALVLTAGCSGTHHRRCYHEGHWASPRFAAAEGRDLIFNPDWAGLAVYEPGRSDWPSTVASELPIEVVGYQEVIHDNQNPSGFSDNNYYRQFNSYRTGFTRR